MNKETKQPAKILTGNPAVDMIYAAIQHYKKFGRKIKVANLDKSYWGMFESFMKEQENADNVQITQEGIQFKNLLVRQGTKFQKDRLVCELHTLITKEQSN